MGNQKRDNKLAVWRPTDDQRKVAELLATGYSQNRAAAICGIPQRTISSWWNELAWSEQFRTLVGEINRQFEETRVLDSTIKLAELLHHQAVTGERNGDDSAVVLARELLAATSWKRYANGEYKKFGAP